MSATINLEKKHFPVLLNELISILSPLYGGTFIDCTFGQGHYSKKILEFKENKIIALDRDKDVHPKSKLLKEKFKNRFQFYNIKFSQIKNLNLDTSYLKGIIFDLGYSTIQINDGNLKFTKVKQTSVLANSNGTKIVKYGIMHFAM